VSKFIDLTGKTFGKWRVLSVEKESRGNKKIVYCICKCSCGAVHKIQPYDLVSGKSVQCVRCRGIRQRIDLLGKTLGELTVLSMVDGLGNQVRWNCSCSCGKYCVKTTSYLRHSKWPSCGCAAKRKIEDLTGRGFGELIVLSMVEERDLRGEIQWNCKCSCGDLCTFSGGELKRGRNIACKICKSRLPKRTCMKDLTGRTFGELTALLPAAERTNSGNVQWACVCSCGARTLVSASSLLSGNTKSCGCIHKYKNRKEALLKNAYADIRYLQNKRWSLGSVISFRLFKKLIFMPCEYCGVAHSKELNDYKRCSKDKISDTVIYVNGIDRLDSSEGYVEGNVVSCCIMCNRTKMDMPNDDFQKYLDNVVVHCLAAMSKDDYIDIVQKAHYVRLP